MLRRIFDEQRLLVVAGAAFAVLFAILVVLALVDPTEISGVNRWLKPIKFAVSIAAYLWTLAVYLASIEGADRAKRVVGGASAALMVGEMVLILMQAARGVRSHFNIATPFDVGVFATMGVMIFINTLLAVCLLALLFRAKVNAPPAVVWGLRFGVMLFIAASVEGGYMSQHLAHAVGVADGGPGLPLANWSTTGGDLRVAHFVGLHGLQAAPLFALAADRLRLPLPTLQTTLFAALYFAGFTLVLVQALLGKPVL